MHKFAGLAATASMAAHEQGKFWPFHDELFENYNRLNETVVREIAKKVGLNLKRFDESLKDPQIRGMINRDLSDGAALQVRGTPSIFVNGKVLRNRSMEGFQEIIDAELRKAGKR